MTQPGPHRGTLFPLIAALMPVMARGQCVLLFPCLGQRRQVPMPDSGAMAPGRLLAVGGLTLHVAARGRVGLSMPLGRGVPVLVLTDAQGGLWLLFPQGAPALRRLALILSLPAAHQDVLAHLATPSAVMWPETSPSG